MRDKDKPDGGEARIPVPEEELSHTKGDHEVLPGTNMAPYSQMLWPTSPKGTKL